MDAVGRCCRAGLITTMILLAKGLVMARAESARRQSHPGNTGLCFSEQIARVLHPAGMRAISRIISMLLAAVAISTIRGG
jgi:hypothetical protein